MKITYEEIEPYLLEFAQNVELPEEIEYRIKAYLQKNPDLQKELDELKDTADFLTNMPLATPEPKLSIGFYAMLAQEQAKNNPLATNIYPTEKPKNNTPPIASQPKPTQNMRKWVGAIGVACVLLLGFGISWQMIFSEKKNQEMAMQTQETKNDVKQDDKQHPKTKTNPTNQTQDTNSENENPTPQKIKKYSQNPVKVADQNTKNEIAGDERETDTYITKKKQKSTITAITKSEIPQNARITNKKEKKRNTTRIRTKEDDQMQEGVGNFSTYDNRNATIHASLPAPNSEMEETETNNSFLSKPLSTNEKINKINEAQASTVELLQLLEKDQSIHVKIWAIHALENQITEKNKTEITQKVANLLPSHTNIALQMATLDWIKKHNPTNKKELINLFLKNNTLLPIIKKQAEEMEN